MSDPSVPGGNNPIPSGAPDDPKQTVAYETHAKLLGEKKRLAEAKAAADAELETLRAKEKEREEQELAKQKNYEQILKNRDEELKALREGAARVETERLQARKLDAFIKTLGGTLEDKFWSLVDLDKIAIDPATKAVDEMSVAKYVEDYRKTYPETIRKPGAPSMPSNAPQGTGGRLTVEEWKALPLKEKRARMHEVVQQKQA